MKIWLKSLLLLTGFTALMLSCSDDDSFWEAMIPETDDTPTLSRF